MAGTIADWASAVKLDGGCGLAVQHMPAILRAAHLQVRLESLDVAVGFDLVHDLAPG